MSWAARKFLTGIDRRKDRDEGEGMRDEAGNLPALIHPFALIPHPFVILSILSIPVKNFRAAPPMT
jgi:hypothetical protein